MTTKRLSKQAEDQLLSAVKGMCRAVEDGLSPTAAAIKTAADNNYGTEMIKLMCQGYNVGAVTHQREKSGSILDKMAQVPLADVDEVIAEAYPEKITTPPQEKAASVVDDCYRRPPRARVAIGTVYHEKCAADLRFKKPEAPVKKQEDIVGELRGYNKEIKEAKAAIVRTRHTALYHLGKLADYFKQSSAMPIEQFEGMAKTKYGATVELLSDYIRQRNEQPAVKRAEVRLPTSSVDWNHAPYSLLEPTMEALRSYQQAIEKSAETTMHANLKAAKALVPIVGVTKEASVSVLPRRKKTAEEKHADVISNALAFTAANTASKGAWDSLFGAPDKAKEDAGVADELMELSDPQYEDEIRKVRTQRMIHDLIKNDDVLSGYAPQKVVGAYNDLAEFSPRIADRPVMVRSVLRKWLPQGSLDTFETTDLANAEKTLSEIGTKGVQDATFRAGKVSHAKPARRSGVLVSR